MVFTPPSSFVIRSREFGDGSEYDMESDSQVMPDHYVKRLWRQRAMAGAEGRTVRQILELVRYIPHTGRYRFNSSTKIR